MVTVAQVVGVPTIVMWTGHHQGSNPSLNTQSSPPHASKKA